MPLFSTTLKDHVFQKLICNQVSHVPSTFFTHVQASIKHLLMPAWFQCNTTWLYPQHLILAYTPKASMHTEWICIHLMWDSYWGFNLWHIFVNESSDFLVSVSFVLFVYPYSHFTLGLVVWWSSCVGGCVTWAVIERVHGFIFGHGSTRIQTYLWSFLYCANSIICSHCSTSTHLVCYPLIRITI